MRKVILASPVATLVPKEILLMLAQVVLANGADRPKLANSFRDKAWKLIKADPNLKGTTNLKQLKLPWDNSLAPWDSGYSKVVKAAQAFVDKYDKKGSVKVIAPKAEPLQLVDSLVMQFISKPENLKLTERLGKGPVSVINKRGSKLLYVTYRVSDLTDNQQREAGELHRFAGTFTASGNWGSVDSQGCAREALGGRVSKCTDEQALKAVTAIFNLAKKKGFKAVK